MRLWSVSDFGSVEDELRATVQALHLAASQFATMRSAAFLLGVVLTVNLVTIVATCSALLPARTESKFT